MFWYSNNSHEVTIKFTCTPSIWSENSFWKFLRNHIWELYPALDHAAVKINSLTKGNLDNSIHLTTGYYMYVEASTKAEGHNAILLSPRYHGLGPYCVEFYYHMYGHHIGTLNVYTKVRIFLFNRKQNFSGIKRTFYLCSFFYISIHATS